MALLPLRNALSFLDSAPTAMNFRVDPSNNSPVWNATSQYFLNDCVKSPVTGGLYIFAGNATNQTTLRGGTEPWEDSFTAVPNWVSVSPDGLSDVTSTPATATMVVTANTPATITAGSLSLDSTLATPGATFLVTWQGVWNNGGVAFTATDQLIWSFAPDGTAPVTVRGTVAPGLVVAPFYMSGSAVVTIPSDGTQIVGALTSGPTALAVAPTLSGLRVTYSRIQ